MQSNRRQRQLIRWKTASACRWLRYADELRKPEDFFDEMPPEKPSKGMVDLAVQLISRKTAPFKPEKFEDHYQTALQELVKAKLKGRKIIAPPETPRALGGNSWT